MLLERCLTLLFSLLEGLNKLLICPAELLKRVTCTVLEIQLLKAYSRIMLYAPRPTLSVIF